MEFIRKSGLSRDSYFLSNRYCFFHRFADSGFKNKWTGLWHRETKFLEFFAVRAGGEWLSEENCRSLSYNGLEAVHTFRLPGNPVTQRLLLPGTPHLVVQLSSEKPFGFEVELAVNIRKRHENRTTRQYAARCRGDSLKAYNSLGSLGISASPGMRFEECQVYREHWPSGEPQNYFMPGTISLPGREATLVLTPSFSPERQPSQGNLQKSLDERRRLLASLGGFIRTDNRLLERGFFWSALATEFCRKRRPGLSSWYAGLPWFQHFWARDIFWVVPSLMALGYFEDVRRTLEFFAESSEGGRIPNNVSKTEGKHMNAIDPTPLWIISLESYVMNSGDLPFLRRMRPFLEASIRFLFSCDTDGDGYIEHDLNFSETWMDTLKRESRAVDIQALYFRALLSAQRMLSLLHKKGIPEEVYSRAGLLKERFERDFFQNGFFVDRLLWKQAIPVRTANALVPLLCGFRAHAREILETIESEPFTTARGVRSRAGGEPDFSPGGYHTGASWSLTTAWACAAEFLSGRPSAGWRYLKIMLQDIDRDSLGCIGECWNSSDLSHSGSPLQLWGSGFVPRLVDEFMLGIEIDSLKREITVSPYLPPGTSRIERLRRTGLGTLRLMFRKSGSSVKVSCSDRRFSLVKK
jgi:glycogen debranching enzyme